MKRIFNIRQNTAGRLLQGIVCAAGSFQAGAIFFQFLYALLGSVTFFWAYMVWKIHRSKKTGWRFDCLDVLFLFLGAAAFWGWIMLYNWLV